MRGRWLMGLILLLTTVMVSKSSAHGGDRQCPAPSLRQQVEQFLLHRLAPPAPAAAVLPA